MLVAAGSPEPVPMEPLRCALQASPSAGSPDRPKRSSPVKNRKRENCTSGTVRDEDGNILIYSAKGQGSPFRRSALTFLSILIKPLALPT
jgi:hypothetical protein